MDTQIEIFRAETLARRTGAYYVRIQGMAQAHGISPEAEFDAHDTPQTQYIVLYDGVLPVACCRLYPENETEMMLGRLVVLPEYRGRGLGSAALSAAEQWAREQGFSAAVIEARVEKTAFYENRGYVQTNGTVLHGVTFDCIRMTKEL